MPRDGSVLVPFRGNVSSGRGQCAFHLRSVARELEQFISVPLCPGSLNVILAGPVRLLESAGATFDQGRRMVWAASMNGVEVWIYRWREAPLHIAEILAPIHLRDRFGLKDGDEITLTVTENKVEPINLLGRLAWNALWLGRRNWSYSKDSYYQRTMNVCTKLGAAQQQPAIKGTREMSIYAAKTIIKRTPLVGAFARNMKSRISRGAPAPQYQYVRLDTDSCANDEERSYRQILNVLSFTKTSNSAYAAQEFPAAYHTINIKGHKVKGQRDPALRLALVPFDFHGKSVLDIGCNQGGMIHQVADVVKWAVGIDYDARMINAANRVKIATGAHATSFYVLNLETDPLQLISDFLPGEKADISFLLSVCMWIKNWKEVIDFAQSKSHSMLFESNGTPEQQQEQINYLRSRYRQIDALAETSEDDPNQKLRKLFYLSQPI
jgi:bifunctional DNA-binding transcriptional regulator/antitoxin component of YhaV-PrlF toxin-antitoxin module